MGILWPGVTRVFLEMRLFRQGVLPVQCGHMLLANLYVFWQEVLDKKTWLGHHGGTRQVASLPCQGYVPG